MLPYLTPGGAAHQVLVEHLHTKAFLEQVKFMVHGTHTGMLEVLHSAMLTGVHGM